MALELRCHGNSENVYSGLQPTTYEVKVVETITELHGQKVHDLGQIQWTVLILAIFVSFMMSKGKGLSNRCFLRLR